MKSHGWEAGGPVRIEAHDAQTYTKGSCRVIVGREDRHGDGRLLWHLSISHPARYPHWDEIKDARYALLPLGLTFAMLLPPPGEYVNVHRNCFHLWEIADRAQTP